MDMPEDFHWISFLTGFLLGGSVVNWILFIFHESLPNFPFFRK